MAILRVEGRNIGDEGFGGSNVRDMETGRMSKDAAEFLTETIKKAIAPIEYSVKTNKVAIALTAKNMAEAIKDNTQEFQEIIQENGEDTQDQLLKLLTMMSDAQKKTGDASVLAIKEVIKQIEKIKASDPSGKLTETLGLDKQQKDLSKQIGRQTVFGAAFKKFTNVDLRTERAMSALSPTKLFGLDPGAGDIIADQKTQLSAEGVTSSVQELGEALVETKKEEIVEKAKTTPTVDKNSEGGVVFESGTDRVSPAMKQVELLEQILAQLKKMESFDSSSGFNMPTVIPDVIPDVLPDVDVDDVDGPDKDKKNKNKGPKNKKPGLFRRAASGLGKVAGVMSTVASPAVLAMAATVAAPIALGVYLAQKNSNPLPAGPERTRRGPGGREYTTDAPLSFNERRDMEEYGTLDREEIQRIQMERAGYSQPDVVQSTPITQLTTQEIQNSQRNNPALIQAVKNMSPAQKEIFLEQNPHMRSVVEAQNEALENPRQSTEPDMLTIPGSGVLSPEAQGMIPQVTPTGDAVSNMSEAYDQMVSNVTNIFNNTTNNNGSGPQSQPILTMPSSVRQTDSAFRVYQQGQTTG